MPARDRTPTDSWTPPRPDPLCWDQPFPPAPDALLVSNVSLAKRVRLRAGTQEEDTACGHSVVLPLGSASSPPPLLVPGFAACTGLGDGSESFAGFQCRASSFSLETLIVRALCSACGLQHGLSVGLRPHSVSLDASERFQTQE